MKKTYFTLILVLGCYLFGESQNLVLTFTGEQEETFNHVLVDSIFIRNKTQDCDTLIRQPDTVFYLYFTSQDELILSETGNFEIIKTYPNPFSELTSFVISVKGSSRLYIGVHTILGESLTGFSGEFSPGLHLFSFRGGKSNLYLISVSDGNTKKSVKLINVSPESNHRHMIEYIGFSSENSELKSVDTYSRNEFEFYIGDELQYIGYSDGYEFDVIYDLPEENSDYVFQFAIPDTFNCGDEFTDKRDNKTYQTIQIGDQCWIAENLSTGNMINGNQNQQNNSEIEKYCYEDNSNNCDTYGGLYQWDEMMQYDTIKFLKGICPEGWHLPTIEEWNTLIDSTGGPFQAGEALKLGGSSGFEALMGGYRNTNGNFSGEGSNTYYWTSDQNNGNLAYYNMLTQSGSNVQSGYEEKQKGFSVRCLRGLPIIIDTNVIEIDTNIYELISDSVQLSQGIYKYNYKNGYANDINVDDIILGITDQVIGITDKGYLRKVNAKTDEPPILTLETSQANLEDVYEEAEFNFGIGLDSLESISDDMGNQSNIVYLTDGVELYTRGNRMIFDFNNTVIYDNGNLNFTITDGQVVLWPEFKFEFKVWESVIRKLAFYTDGSALKNDIAFSLSADGEDVVNDVVLLGRWEQSSYFPTGSVAIYLTITVDLNAYIHCDLDADLELISGYTNNNTVSLGSKYDNGTWSTVWYLEKDISLYPVDYNNNLNLDELLTIKPSVSIELYGAPGPYFETELWNANVYNYTIPSMDFDGSMEVGLDAEVGIDAMIFGNTLFDYNDYIAGFNSNLWILPDTMNIESGNNQSGGPGEELPDPIQVKVTDNHGEGFPNIAVHFEVTGGGGAIEDTVVLTSTSGYAYTTWTLGPDTGQNTLEASVYHADGTHINGSPLEFTAMALYAVPTVTTGDVFNITYTNADVEGEIVELGGSDIIRFGHCWSTDPDPTIEDNITDLGSSDTTGVYISQLTNLDPYTTYYVKAYAENDAGIAYGDEIDFYTNYLPTVITGDTSNVTQTTADVEGEITNLGGSDIISHGHCWSTSPNPTINDNHTDLGGTGTTGSYTSNLTNLEGGTTYYVKAYAENDDGIAYGNQINFNTDPWGPCDGVNSLLYGGQVYNTVEIGDQCWLKENLNIGVRIDGGQAQTDNATIEKYCYDDDPNNCDDYGGLYQWDEMMQYVTNPAAQGICPDDWHIPTDNEYKILEGTVDSQFGVGDPEWDEVTWRGYDAGDNLKSQTGWFSNGNGSDAFDFTAVPGGFSDNVGTFGEVEEAAYFWTSNEYDNQWSWYRGLNYALDEAWRHYGTYKACGFSVRCIKDQ